MKLLTWMHRKIRQNNNEIYKEFPQGQTIILNNHNLFPKQTHSGVNFAQPPRDSYGRKSFASLESTRLDDLDRDSSAKLSESFHGFLAIGTLGAEPYISEPETPTFFISVDNIAERETEVTQSELNLINEELEKVIAADQDSSRRNSHVSNARSSSTSTISLGGKIAEVTESNENGKTTCPLQEYLLGTAVDLPERKSTAKKGRASLGELFQRHRAEENSAMKSERGEKQTHKDGDKSASNIVKKILRKKIGHFSSAANGDATAEYPSETKLHKMLNLFHKKVHPENSTDIQRLDSRNKNRFRAGDSRIADADSCFGGQVLPDEAFPTISDANRKRYMRQYKNQPYPTKFTSNATHLAGNKEFWIKTDADYLVLEL